MLRIFFAVLAISILTVNVAEAQFRIALERFSTPQFNCGRQDTTAPSTYQCKQEWWGRNCRLVDAPHTSETVCSFRDPVLPDGDEIAILTECCAPPGTIGIVLQVSDRISWWKELAIGFQKISLSGRGYSIPSTPEMRVGPMWWATNNVAGRELVFSKAKFAGWHSAVYTIDLGALKQYAERIVVFRWTSDGSGGGGAPNREYANAFGAPIDGTILQDDAGAIWVIAGGAKFHVPTPEIFAQLFPGAIPFRAHGQGLTKWPGTIPVDNTLISEENGKIWAIAGQAKFHVPSVATLAQLYPNQVPINLWNQAVHYVPMSPIDDTLIREDNGAIWVVVGKAKFHVPDQVTYDRLFGDRKLFQLWDGAPQQIPDIPQDGTLLREENGSIWVIEGKAKFHIPDPATLDRVYPQTKYFQLWDGALQQIPDIPADGTRFCEESCQVMYVVMNGHKHPVDPADKNTLPFYWIFKGAMAQIPN